MHGQQAATGGRAASGSGVGSGVQERRRQWRAAAASGSGVQEWRPAKSGCAEAGARAVWAAMSDRITRINPDQLHPTPGYHHITVVESGRTAFLAGQCPLDRDGALVGPGDLDAQIDQVAANAVTALAAVGAGPGQVVRSVVYVASDENAVLSAAWDRLTGSALGPAFTTASTLLGVTRLGFTGQLVEVDLTAALPD